MNLKIFGLLAIVATLGFFLWRSPFSTQAPPKQALVESIYAGGAEGYDSYALDIPSDWQAEEDTEEGLSRLTISKNDYEININQEPGGAIDCFYNEKGPKLEYPQQNYTKFSEISTKEGKQFRRGVGFNNKLEFCQKLDDSWSTPTVTGYIHYVVPQDPDDKILREMDTIISSLIIPYETDEERIKKYLKEYIPQKSAVKEFEVVKLEIKDNLAKVIIKALDTVTDDATVFLEKIEGTWVVIWGPGTYIPDDHPVRERIPQDFIGY